MSDKSYRIKTNVGSDDNVISVNLKQGFKTLNILSLEINPEDAYDVQTSDYGVIVGRVLANNAFGVPNVKVSVFVPIEENDENNYVISNEYPYKTPQSKDNNGVKYNLIHQKTNGAGTFPSKNMLLDNGGVIEVFDKYWKYTAVTNESGDYMIFGVPTGTTQVHYDCDLSDIGILSQHPYDFIAKGYDANLFKSKEKFTDTDLSSAVHIISQDVTVFVYPFWGDKNANKIGITRKDIDINYEFTPSCVFMGSSITDPVGSYISLDGEPNGNCGKFDSLSTSVGNIEMIRYTQDGRIEEVKDNVVGVIDGNGVWCYQIQMNLDRIGTDEYGNIMAINDPNRGIPTRARVRFRISLTDTTDANASSYTAKFLVPCNPPLTYAYNDANDPKIDIGGTSDKHISSDDWDNFYEFGENTPDCCFRDLYWGKVYSIKQYYPRFHFEYYPRDLMYGDSNKHMLYGDDEKKDEALTPLSERPKVDGDKELNTINYNKDYFDLSGYPTRYAFNSSCISSVDVVNGLNTFPYTTLYAGAEEHIEDKVVNWFYYHFSDFSKDYNLTSRGLHFCFENDWINGCLYFPRVVIQRNNVDDYDYFGRVNDDDPNKYYNGLYISGRHHWLWNHTGFQLINSTAPFNDNGYYKYDPDAFPDYYNRNTQKTAVFQDQVSIFSRVQLYHGIITKRKTMLDESVFYYRCGVDEYSSQRLDWRKTYKQLYTTDIILLGNLEDIYDSLPPLYKNLPSTTAIFPPVSPPRKLGEAGMTKHGYGNQILYMSKYVEGEPSQTVNDELVDIFCNYKDILEDRKGYVNPNTVTNNREGDPNGYALFKDTLEIVWDNYRDPSTHAWTSDAWKEMMIRLLRRSSLFFGLKINDNDDFLEYDVPTFINTSRICELDVHNDAACLAPGGSDIIPINGIIDSLDISTNENRSAFATMNYDIEKYSISPITGYRQYVTTPIYVNSFDGRLKKYIESMGFRNESDDQDNSYLKFRFGRKEINWGGPYTQTCAQFYSDESMEDIFGYCNGDIVLPKDSFYFYFGLRTGFSALDALMNKFFDGTKETPSEQVGIKCYVNQDNYECDDEIETGKVTITFTNMLTPVTYEIYFKNMPYKKGVSESNIMSISGLTHGVYKVVATDSHNRVYTSYFSMLGRSIALNANSYRDELDNKGHVKFISDYSSKITDISPLGNDGKSVSATTDSAKTYEIDFSTQYNSISGTTVIFNEDLGSIDALIRRSDDDSLKCIESRMTYVFHEADKPDITLNNIPVAYLKDWRSYSGNTAYEVDEPDYVFSGKTYYVWDGINTAHPKASQRNYNFPTTLDYSSKLSYVSSMCSAVFGNRAMYLENNSNNTNYVPVSLYPYYGSYEHYFTPYLHWDEEATESSIMQTSNNGYAQLESNVPHIVGSNYPIAFNRRTLLKKSANEEEGVDKYINNKTIKKDLYGVIGGIYGINLFGVRNKQYRSLDLPGLLDIMPEIPINRGSNGNYNIDRAYNFFGVRTVDKRFDYQFTFKTPLLLPSGYSSFTHKKPLINGKTVFDLYGGFRMGYDSDTYAVNCYTDIDGEFAGGPDSGATLYLKSIYQDNDASTPMALSETKKNIWYSSGECDIDHVVLSGNTINGINNITMQFVDCSTDFTNGFVKPGNTESVYLSYMSGVNVIRKEDEDYDIEYNVSGVLSSAFTEYFASFSGSTMTFNLAVDEEWHGLTYTDVDTRQSHNGGVFPEWGRLYESEKPYSGRAEELGVYRCDPLSNGDFTVTSAYTVNFIALSGTLPAPAMYNGTNYISAFCIYNGHDLPLTDKWCSGNLQFEIDDTDASKMNSKLGSNSFLIIPTRKVYIKSGAGTSLKQGIVYNTGYVYYAGSISVSVDKSNKHAIIRLNTPLRQNDGTIDYELSSLKIGDRWHTIGNVDNYNCDGASITYDSTRCEFDLTVIDGRDVAVMYFEIENGLKYRIIIDFVN